MLAPLVEGELLAVAAEWAAWRALPHGEAEEDGTGGVRLRKDGYW